jgi:DNA-binding beta-propeller fold protein YncE
MFTSSIRLLVIIFIFISCKPPAKESDPLPGLQQKGIYIVNEGNFQSGNGSVSFYDSATNSVTQDLYFLKNNKAAGDVCQSLYFYHTNFFLVVNNSSKIEILDSNFVDTKTITGLTSPRYIAFSNTYKGYVTDLYGKGVTIINTHSYNIEKKIAINYWTEEIVNYKDTMYVTSPTSKYLYLIDATTEVLKDSIDIGFGSSSITIDDNNLIWILCDGNATKSIYPSLKCINPIDRSIVRNIPSTTFNSLASKIHYSKMDKNIYWIEKDLYKLNTQNIASNKEIYIQALGKNFYGLVINQTNGDIVLSDAGDYSQRSTIHIYNKNGLERNSFKAGIISGNMLIK